MTTVLSPPKKIQTNVYLYEWTGTAPFRIFNYEIMDWIEESTEATFIEIVGDSDIEPPAIEVFDSDETTDECIGASYPDKVIIQFRGYRYADYYRIDLDSGGGYEEVGRMYESGQGYYQFVTSILETGATYDYRVVVVDLAEGEAEIDVSVILTTLPILPELSYTYDSGTGDVTIDEV